MKSLKFLFILTLISFFSCKKKENPTPVINPKSELTINSDPQFNAIIENIPYSFLEGKNDVVFYKGPLGPVISPESGGPASKNYMIIGTDTISKRILFNIRSEMLEYPEYPNNNLFKDFFSPGSFAYSKDLKHGVSIGMSIGNTYWSTDNGSGDQTGSSFTIEESKEVSNPNAYCEIKVKIKFDCILYDSTGASKKLKDGVFIGSILE